MISDGEIVTEDKKKAEEVPTAVKRTGFGDWCVAEHYRADDNVFDFVLSNPSEHQQKVDEMIVANRRVKQKDIANALDISKERVHHIITVHLGYRKVSARWVPRQLTVEMKAQRKTICTQLLERFTHDSERFLRSIITGDESWVHHYDPESKMQSMQYRHKNSPAPKKFKGVASARKVLLTIFWDMEGTPPHTPQNALGEKKLN
ncbi:hypothetical protein EGW08_017875 [Elysia chlorotica]|uniref:Mariner Mos1 transposase n=1 Tax=Elysia chlorotica TaxID=188477 RepID=A0A433SYK0_ELYCH|nr:hypothetical protein EGW08_017875 [Elysia chlorotica]